MKLKNTIRQITRKMKTHNIMIKSIYILFAIVLLNINKLNAQDSDLEIKIESVSVSNSGADDGKIIVNVSGSNPEYIYRLLDNAPWDNGNILQVSEPTRENNYVFQNLAPGKYAVCVTDNAKVTRCEYITVKEE
jgi:hypothetical protein